MNSGSPGPEALKRGRSIATLAGEVASFLNAGAQEPLKYRVSTRMASGRIRSRDTPAVNDR